MEQTTNTAMEAVATKKLYALSDIRYTLKGFLDGQERTIKSEVGFMLVFETKAEAKKHKSETSRILEIVIS